MASRLSPIPGSEPKSLSDVLASSTAGKSTAVPTHVRKDVAKRKSKETPADKFTIDKETPVTEQEYRDLMADRPKKFGPKSSGFVRGGGKKDPEHACGACVHFYNAPIAARAMGKPTHATCEVTRQSDSEDEIFAEDTCRLFSQDGINLPLLNSEEKSEE